jgi:hypothetical protein
VALRDLTDRSAVLQAINEFRELGEDAFLETGSSARDGFRSPTKARRFHPRRSSVLRMGSSFLMLVPSSRRSSAEVV